MERIVRSFTEGMVCASILMFLWSPANGQDLAQTYSFELEHVRFERLDAYDLVSYGDLDGWGEIGHPLLPAKIVHIHIPPGKKIEEVRVRDMVTQEISGEYAIFPAQPQQIITRQAESFVEPDPWIYSSSEPYPTRIVRSASRGYLAGYPVGSLIIHPIRYIPSNKKLIFVSSLTVEIRYADIAEFGREAVIRQTTETGQIHMLRTLTETDPEGMMPIVEMKLQSLLSPNVYPYIIITTDTMQDAFQDLADWKSKKGLLAKSVTKEWIEGTYTGYDIQQKIRRFIKDAHQTWDTQWILLGGDTNIIRDRKAFAMDCEYGNFSDNYIPCDLYYADLDGDWNANGNDLYGEVEDDVDLYPDVFVGRASVNNRSEAAAWIQKLLAYEKYEDASHANNMLFLAGIEWNTPYTNAGDMKDFIDEMYVPDRFDPITKLYSAQENDDISSVLAALNAGQNIVNHSNHAWYTGVSLGHQLLGIPEIDGLYNGMQGGIFYSTGCWPAAFDYDCFAEHFITNPNGGGVAFVGNSRYGWGSPGNPLYGYSDRFDQMFFKVLFVDGLYHIGQTLATAKSRFIPFSGQMNVYRWHQYQVNLLGDPEMPIWTGEPAELIVNHPDELPSTGGGCTITVTDDAGPVEGALICLMQDTTVYLVGMTAHDGQIDFHVQESSPAEPLTITVTAHNFVPYEDTISVQAEGPYLHIETCSTVGSEDHLVQPETDQTFDVWMKNYGSESAEQVEIRLATESSRIFLIDSIAAIATILPKDSVLVEASFSFHVDGIVENGDVCMLRWDLRDGDGGVWQNRTVLTCITPVLSCVSCSATDSMAIDSDGQIDPGDDIIFEIQVQNSGLDSAQGVVMDMSCVDGSVEIIDTEVDLGALAPGQTVECSVHARIADSCLTPAFPSVELAFETDRGYAFADTVSLTVGCVTFTDDIERVTDNWTHSGSPDLWHISTSRQHSGDHSWSCSRVGEYQYDNKMSGNTLTLKPLIIGRRATLSFWAWYEFPNYGTTGFYIEVHDGIRWKVLDFIGSGGALNVLPTGMDWYEYDYDLSSISPGTLIKVRFRFQSDDEDVTEGVYIDDVIIEDENADLSLKALPRPLTPDFTVSEDGNTNTIALSWEDAGTITEIEAFSEEGYVFQGYKVYQLPSSQPCASEGLCVGIFDIVDGVKEISGGMIDPVTGIMQVSTRHEGSDSGLQYSIQLDEDILEDLYFVQGKTYYYAVTAYTYQPDSTVYPRSSESLLEVESIVYHQGFPGPSFGDTLAVNHISGRGDCIIAPIIVDPNIFNGHNYRLEFATAQSDALTWSLVDLNDQKTVMSGQHFLEDSENAPVVDGFQLMVERPDTLDFFETIVNGPGNYHLSSHYKNGWSSSARAVDTYGAGIVDRITLCEDYELRFTGVYENTTSSLVRIREGTGSLATLVDARYYSISNHPLNPYPGSQYPFTVRIPFEVWNVDRNEQVNFVILDRSQELSSDPFYAFNPDERMYCWILNTPYHPSPVDWSNNEQQFLTWNVDFWTTQFVTGDILEIKYANPLSLSDVYTFSTDMTGNSGAEIIDTTYDLLQNYPNPFNAQTTIRFRIVELQPVTLTIYNLLGEVVREFHTGESQLDVDWDGTDMDGRLLSSGVYFCRMVAGNFEKVRKMILLR